MPYLVLADKNGEFDRRELSDVTVIGRATDCTICVRDILLSRKHCRLEPFNGRWVITDLGSKNGTRIGPETITRHILEEGEVIRMGKIQVCYRDGPYVPPPKDLPKRRDARPTDPKEALAGTVSGFQYFDMEEDSRKSGFPIPKPKPADPASYRQDEVHSMVTQMTSSSWDLALSEPDVHLQTNPADAPPMVQRQVAVQKARTEATQNKKESNGNAIRSSDPNRRAVIPRWLAWTYIAIVVLLICLCVGIIVSRSIN